MKLPIKKLALVEKWQNISNFLQLKSKFSQVSSLLPSHMTVFRKSKSILTLFL